MIVEVVLMTQDILIVAEMVAILEMVENGSSSTFNHCQWLKKPVGKITRTMRANDKNNDCDKQWFHDDDDDGDDDVDDDGNDDD